MAQDKKDAVSPEAGPLHAEAPQYEREALVDFVGAPEEVEVVRKKGRLGPDHAFLLNLRPHEEPHLHVRSVRPFEALFRALPSGAVPTSDEEDLSPRVVTAMTPRGNRLTIYSIAALVMADADGFTAGEVVWLSRAVSTVLDRTDHVLVVRGDGDPLLPITSKVLSPI